MNTGDVQTLYAYNLWANRRMFSALDKLSGEQFAATVQSSYPSIEESVLHILAAEWIWLKRWKGTSPLAKAFGPRPMSAMRSVLSEGGIPVDSLSTLPGLRGFSDTIEQERQAFLQTLNDDALLARLKYMDMAGKEFSMPLGQLLQHVVNHGTYHRGQITTLLRQAGAETAALDMTFFFREDKEEKKKECKQLSK